MPHGPPAYSASAVGFGDAHHTCRPRFTVSRGKRPHILQVSCGTFVSMRPLGRLPVQHPFVSAFGLSGAPGRLKGEGLANQVVLMYLRLVNLKSTAGGRPCSGSSSLATWRCSIQGLPAGPESTTYILSYRVARLVSWQACSVPVGLDGYVLALVAPRPLRPYRCRRHTIRGRMLHYQDKSTASVVPFALTVRALHTHPPCQPQPARRQQPSKRPPHPHS